ncbi:MAG: aspartate carbamoyltransferase catalytic subunit, partial [Pseudomonadota bacterium]
MAGFAHRHLLGIGPLAPQEIVQILDLAERYAALNLGAEKHLDLLNGRTQINLFFEPST